jgi:two-component system, NarL family, captular synthesis response regulator RcsB
MPLKMLLSDDHPIVVEGVIARLEAASHAFEIEVARNGGDTLQRISRGDIDVAVTDLSMPVEPGPDGLELIRRMRELSADLRIVVFTSSASSAIVDALREVGADAMVEKGAPVSELIAAIRPGRAGRFYMTRTLAATVLADFGTALSAGVMPRLSPAQVDILRMLAAGHGNQEIARALGISHKTVSRQKRMAMEKLAVSTDLELYQLLQRMALL